jgi:H+/Cl- antiporter ClcA
MAALTPEVPKTARNLYVSVKLSVAKMLLASWGLLAGLSLGREGPSVQIAAGVMHHARRWLPAKSGVSEHGLMLAGGAAGIAAAFNTPLGGVMFAIEELSRKPEQRSNGLLLAAIVLAGLMAVSVYGNSTYFGVIRVQNLGAALLLPGLLVALCSGAAGGLFSRLLVISLAGRSGDWFSRFRQKAPIRFAAACGLAVAVLGLVSHGDTYGSGYHTTRAMLEGHGASSQLYVMLKFVATWITAWAGVPGGLFAPALAIGGALGHDIAQLTAYADAPTLIALGMAGFLAAVTQAPLTAFIIVMEMVDGHALVLSLMASALIASGVSRLISVPLYTALADLQLRRLPAPPT